jgi:hypothetical protein
MALSSDREWITYREASEMSGLSRTTSGNSFPQARYGQRRLAKP